MKKTLIAGLVLLSMHASSFAEDRDWAPYRKLVEAIKLDKFAALPAAERDKVVLYAQVTPENKALKTGDIIITVLHGAARHAFPVDQHGKLHITFDQKWYADDVKTQINVPKGEKMGISFGMDAVVPEGTQWQYATLMGSVKQANGLIKSQAGMLSMFAPKIAIVSLHFAKPAQLKIMAKDGVKTLATDAKNTIRLTPDEALMKENPLIQVSERPLEADLDDK